MALNEHYIFEWDPVKAAINLQKHGVSFERATSVFSDPESLTIYDIAHSRDEDRWVIIGLDKHDILLVAVHTSAEIDDRTTRIRIISARRATTTEASQYQQA
jgi:uncharacterized protein